MARPGDSLGLTARSIQRLRDLYRRFGKLAAQVAAIQRTLGQGATRAPQVRFGVTGGDGYPASPANVLPFAFVDKVFPETLGEQSITEKVWTARKKKGRTLDGLHLETGTKVLVVKVGKRYWLKPIPDEEACDVIPAKWSQIAGWVADARQALMHAPNACPAWVSVGPCPEEE